MAQSIDQHAVDFFSAAAPHWWRAKGEMGALHKINEARLAFMKQAICAHYQINPEEAAPFRDMTMLDVGCGAGLVTEPLTRLGGIVTGVDAGEAIINAARTHATAMGLSITYQHGTAEQMALEGRRYDVVVALEIIEHVRDPKKFLETVASLVKPEGLLILSTLNRTPLSYLLGIVAAERILRWVPQGAHDWSQFLKPSEIQTTLKECHMKIDALSGIGLSPLTGEWQLTKNLEINYILAARYF